MSFEAASPVHLGAKQSGCWVQERAIRNRVANSRTKHPVPTRGSKADVMDSYGTEEVFDLGGIDMKDCHSS